MLNGNNLSCVRGDRTLFSGLDLSVGGGEWLHVRGANGSGKTSLLRLLAGLSSPASGEIRWNGNPITGNRHEYHQDLMYLGHQAGVKEDLTALENVELAGALDGCQPSEQVVLASLARFDLRGREDLPVRFFSAGQKRRVLLARLVSRRAKLWVLDEPFTALDAAAVDMLGNVVAEHVAEGGMAIVTSHQAVPIPGGRRLDL